MCNVFKNFDKWVWLELYGVWVWFGLFIMRVNVGYWFKIDVVKIYGLMLLYDVVICKMVICGI